MDGYFKVERLTEGSSMVPERQTHILTIYALTQAPLHSAVSLIVRIHGSSHHGVEMKGVLC